MKHFASSSFWKSYRALPSNIRELADKKFELLKGDPYHSSLRLKQLGSLWSIRVGLHYRALATEIEEGLLWFWIGSHADYDKLISE